MNQIFMLLITTRIINCSVMCFLGITAQAAGTAGGGPGSRADEKSLVSDKSVVVLDPGPPGPYHAVTFNHAGNQLVAGGEDDRQTALATPFHADETGKRGVEIRGTSPQLTLWDISTGQRVASFAGHPAPILAACFSRDDGQIATGGVSKFSPYIHNVLKFKKNELGKYLGGREVLTFWDGGIVLVWEVTTGKKLRVLAGPAEPVGAVAVADDRSIVALDRSLTVTTWKADGDRPSHAFRPRPWREGRLFLGQYSAFDAQGHRLVTSASDPSLPVGPDGPAHFGSAKLWDVPTKRFRVFDSIDLSYPDSSVAISPEGKRFAGRQGRSLKIWDFDTGRLVATANDSTGQTPSLPGTDNSPGYYKLLAFDLRGENLISIDDLDRLSFWNATDGSLIRRVQGPNREPARRRFHPAWPQHRLRRYASVGP